MRKLFLPVVLMAAQSLALGQSIRHLVILIKENRSFDHYFGQFPGVTGGPITQYPCVGTTGGCVGGFLAVIPANPNVGDQDCGHYFTNSTSDYDSGAMDKFNQNCFGYSDWAKQYGAATIPHYWSWAQAYGLADHMFASAMGPSYPNHVYTIAATSNEAQDNPEMVAGRPPNGQGGNGWTCDAFHYGRCQSGANTGNLCSQDPDCGSGYVGGSCVISTGTGKCSGGAVGASCTFDSDCSSGYCTNGDTYVGDFYGIDIKGGTGNEMYPGVCKVNRTVGCNSICSGSSHHCAQSDCDPDTPASDCNVADPICTALGDHCDAIGKNDPSINGTPTSGNQFLGAGRGSACPNVTTIADRLDAATIPGLGSSQPKWGMYYSTGNASSTGQLWNPFGYIQHIRYGADWANNIHPITQWITDTNSSLGCAANSSCPADTLPAVSYMGDSGTYSEHPTNTVAAGENFSVTQVSQIMNNAYLWSNTVFLITWDDFGGFADHIAPSQDSIGWTQGIRVPLLCIGRFCRNAVNHNVFTFASILRCIEDLTGVAALNTLDGNSTDICIGQNWAATTTYTATFSVIVPNSATLNPDNCQFTAQSSGASGSTQPNWHSLDGGSCSSSTVISDGGTSWKASGVGPGMVSLATNNPQPAASTFGASQSGLNTQSSPNTQIQ